MPSGSTTLPPGTLIVPPGVVTVPPPGRVTLPLSPGIIGPFGLILPSSPVPVLPS